MLRIPTQPGPPVRGLHARPLNNNEVHYGPTRGLSADLCLHVPPESFEIHHCAAQVAVGLLNSLRPRHQSRLHADTATGMISYRADLRHRPGDFPDLTHLLVHNVLWNEVHSPLLPHHPGGLRCSPIPVRRQEQAERTGHRRIRSPGVHRLPDPDRCSAQQRVPPHLPARLALRHPAGRGLRRLRHAIRRSRAAELPPLLRPARHPAPLLRGHPRLRAHQPAAHTARHPAIRRALRQHGASRAGVLKAPALTAPAP